MSGSGYGRPSDPIDQLSAQLRELEAQVRALRTPRPFQAPILDEDPPETDPTNVWIFPDGKLRFRFLNPAGSAYVYREVSSSSSSGGASSGTATAPPAPVPQSFTTSWTATYSQSYRQSGAQRTDWPTRLYYGSSGDGFNGRNRSLIGFDFAAIATALAGATVNGVRLTLLNLHAWWNDGSDIHFGIHNFSSKPSTWAGGGIPRSMISKHRFPKTGTKIVALPLEFATMIRDGTGKGVALESPSDDKRYYGYAAGFGGGVQQPVLTVDYVK